MSIFAPQIKERAANRFRFSELVPLYPMTSQSGDSDLLETLYPVPLSTGITPFPGHSSESARALLSVLKHNYQTHHDFFNDKGSTSTSNCQTHSPKFLSRVVMPRITYWPYITSALHPRSLRTPIGPATTSFLRLRARVPSQKIILRNTLVMKGKQFFTIPYPGSR